VAGAGAHQIDLEDYVDGKYIEHWEIIGWGARLSAPGYLDCTDWSVFDTEREAKEYLRDTYDVEFEGEEND